MINGAKGELYYSAEIPYSQEYHNHTNTVIWKPPGDVLLFLNHDPRPNVTLRRQAKERDYGGRVPRASWTLGPTLLRVAMQNPTTGRRLQDWTNRNIFAKSFESFELPASYQNAPAASGDVGADRELPDEETRLTAEADDPHGASSDSPITAYQAAWNVTNAIQG
uniref:LTD domain-containing protein n=1 Tax=Steinernema glaseri TaxID=37863 RepID=A0A1I8AJ96_9BILA